ncbi:hypothetical protein [Pseudotamlana carrageenivorans]|uniref:hypothetical protein n=1 Tax=Pseudotamlana carrageenivorans TaxID=2069432 RepID=UPI0013150922|nr:hypothetical protein [Tamlana carrageenivorans]
MEVVVMVGKGSGVFLADKSCNESKKMILYEVHVSVVMGVMKTEISGVKRFVKL